MDEDWDNLLLLDACRHDLFEEANTLSGVLDYRISRGSGTPEFLTENFSERTFNDTVYVTANPMYRTRSLGETFHEVIDVWSDEWNENLQTVTPRAMAEATVKAYKEYPKKRILSHFMQPHYPFIGDSSEEIGNHSGFEYTYRKVTEEQANRDNPTVWELLEEGQVSEELVWKAYKENLQVALPYVKKVLSHFEERTIVTSDHGNAFGERPYLFGRRMYGHPLGIRHDSVCKVPWLVIDKGSRKTLVAEENGDKSANQSDAVQRRLSNLGYVDV